MKRFLSFLRIRFFLIPAVLLLFYTLAGFFLAPYAVRWTVPKYFQDRLHCRASLGAVRINPFLMTFEANAFNLIGPNGEMLAAFERLFFDFEMKSLFLWKAAFAEFLLEKPVLHVTFEPDGSLNLTQLAPPGEEPAPSVHPSDPTALIIQTVAIRDGELTLTDRRQSTPAILSLQALDLDFENLSTVRDQSGSFTFTAKTADGEAVQWQGNMDLTPFRSHGTLSFSDLRTATLWGFVKDSLQLDSPGGRLDLSAQYRIDAGEPSLQLILEDVRAGLSDMTLRFSAAHDDFCNVKKLEIDRARFDLVTRVLQVNQVLLDGGVLRVGIDERGEADLQRVVRREAPQSGEQRVTQSAHKGDGQESVADPQPWVVHVETVQIQNVALNLEDRSRTEPLTVAVSSIAARSSIHLEAGWRTEAALGAISAELNGVSLGTGTASPPLFAANRLFVEGGELNLGARSIEIAHVGLDEGHLHVTRETDGRINWEKLLEAKTGPAADSSSETPGENAAPLKFLVKSFEVSKFQSAFSDQTTLSEAPIFSLRKIRVHVTDIDGTSPMNFEADFEAAEGGSAAFRGTVDLSSPSVEAMIKTSDVNLAALQPYLAPFITLTLESATLSSEGTFRYNLPGQESRIAYQGRINLAQLSLKQPGSGETYLGWNAMEIPHIQLDLEPNALQIDEIRLSKPVGQLIIYEDRTVNLAKIIKEQPRETPPNASDQLPVKDSRDKSPTRPGDSQGKRDETFPFDIGKVRVQDGNLVFADLSLTPKFMTRIHSLKGTVTRISSRKNSVAEIQLDGRVDQYGTTRITGTLDLSDFKHSTDIVLAFRNVEMASVTPYSGRFAGRKIKSGKLTMDLKYRIQDTKLVGDNKIIVDRLVLGEHVKSPDAVNLPLDLAVALLSDSKGRIDIGLPVAGDLNDPQFSLGPLIWKALVSVITKAVTAPFRALGALLGGNGEKFDAVQFEPGSADISPPEQEKLKKVAELLLKRPQLQLAVQGRYSPEADGLEFRHRGVRRALASRAGAGPAPNEDPEEPDFSDSKTRRALEKMFVERFGEPALKAIDRAVEQGEIKPREEPGEKIKEKKRRGFSRVFQTIQAHKIIPGVKSPEQSALLAAELYDRLVESEPVSETALQELADNRAKQVMVELQETPGISADRLVASNPEPFAEDAGLSAGLTLEALVK